MKKIEITQDNFYLGTKCRFKGCKRPKKSPDFASLTNGKISSEYWYGKDKKGSYVIRCSDHWSNANAVGKVFRCGKIASCYWWLITNCKNSYGEYSFRRDYCGKAYFSAFQKN